MSFTIVYLEPLAEVSDRIGRKPGPSGDEDHEQHLVLLAHLIQDVPEPRHGRLARVQVSEMLGSVAEMRLHKM